MTTLAFFHAHPDDEAISTGGTMAKAAAAGHKVVLVLATRGELGEVAEGVLADGETLGEHRSREAMKSAEVLGATAVEFLGYRDSGMVDTDGNADPACFWQADVDEAADRLAALLVGHGVELLSVYDENGTYGHPDHIQVNRVGTRAAQKAGIKWLYEATADRDAIRAMMANAADMGIDREEMMSDEVLSTFGSPAESITTRVDVGGFIDVKRESMRQHASQIDETSWFLTMPIEVFGAAFSTETFIQRSSPDGSDFLLTL